MAKQSIWFITPAWYRFELSRICFAERRWACDELAKCGIDAQVVVIADDYNTELAEEFGFHIIHRKNDYLGAKFNDGYEYAAMQGATHVSAIGSDSWIHPNLVRALWPPKPHVVRYSRLLSVVHTSGAERLDLDVTYEGGGQIVFLVSLLAHTRFRPMSETLAKACDGATFTALNAGPRRLYWQTIEAMPFHLINFRSVYQITNYADLKEKWAIDVTSKPFNALDNLSPANLVADIRNFYCP